MRAILFLALAACAKSTPPAVPEASSSAFVLSSATPTMATTRPLVDSPRDAMEAFRAGWRHDLPLEHMSARRGSCSVEHDRIAKTFAELRHDFTVHGALDDVDRAGECFVVDFIKAIKEDFEGIVTPQGDVLFVWQIPEG